MSDTQGSISDTKMRSSAIFAAIKDDTSVIASIVNADPTQYDFAVTGTFIMGVHDVQYAKSLSLINGPTTRLITLDGVLLRSNVILPSIIGVTSFEGIACLVYTQTLKSAANVSTDSTVTNAATGETTSPSTDSVSTPTPTPTASENADSSLSDGDSSTETASEETTS